MHCATFERIVQAVPNRITINTRIPRKCAIRISRHVHRMIMVGRTIAHVVGNGTEIIFQSGPIIAGFEKMCAIADGQPASDI
ncbi:hypothetical protein D3C73_527600 [compost metagenome]